ncbi:PREDICTED: uncharacterized protein C2orf71 homolog [Condylura cristata]|uniref:uncharacterized protein C2orf71 homolog n=1 Tax=Condylura cristata TaxID=143302 RepID=UPI00064398A3|nr:PREDICTED: uncharacterized protein C2orf71 homolog [Condylura cristata]
MGCTPSHSHLVNSVTRSGFQFFKKPKAILPEPQGGSDRSPNPQLIQNCTCYDTGGALAQRQRLAEGQPHFRRPQAPAEEKLTGGPTCGSRKAMEGLVPNTRTPPPRSHKPQSSRAKGLQFSPRGSRGSPGSAFSGEDSEDSNAPEGSKGQRKPRHRTSGQRGHRPPTAPPAPASEGQADFPEALVKAHRLAYAYLRSSLSRYEVILCLTHQAMRTQELLQPMVNFLLLCFDQVHQLLGEMAQDGEELLREVREELARPWRLGTAQEQPDLLQQLLQYTVSKLQALSGSAASLTGGLLEGSGSYLHSTVSLLAGKLSAKRGADERLRKTLGRLESLASGPSDPGVQGLPLCSEDSGIGADSESGQLVDKLGKQASWDSVSEPAEWKVGTSATEEARLSGYVQQQRPLWMGPDRLLDCPFSRLLMAQTEPAAQGAAGSPWPDSTIPENTTDRPLTLSNNALCSSLGLGLSAAPLPSKGSRLMDTPSFWEDSSPEREENRVNGINPCAGQEAASQPRPTSSPASAESTFQPRLRELRRHQAQEMILKMKEAISERIKFVPVPSGHQDWAEEEESTTLPPPRPHTVGGSRRGPAGQRRCQSEACLQSQVEDPTFQELRRAQSDLSLRLDMFCALHTRQQGPSKVQAPQPRAAALRPDSCRLAPSNTTRKLKASLAKNFSILPSQDKTILQNHSPHPEGNQAWQGLPQSPPAGDKVSEASGTKDRKGAGPPSRMSVKKLIETFSSPESPRTLGNSQGSRTSPRLSKWGVPVLPPRFPMYRDFAALYSKPQMPPTGRGSPKVDPDERPFAPIFPPLLTARAPTSGSFSDDREADPEFLPPPPLEILMDKSFTSLEPPESSQLARSSPEAPGVPALGRADPACGVWAPPKLRASLSPLNLLPSRSTAIPTRSPSCAGPGSHHSVDSAGKLGWSLSHLPAASEGDRDGAQRQARADRAASLTRHPRKAVPGHHSSHTSAHNGTSESSLARPVRGPLEPERMRQSQERSPAMVRKASPTRARWAPRMDKKHPGLASSPRPAQPSASTVHASPSPPLSSPVSPRVLSPPAVKKRGSPPPQHRLHGPPPKSPPTQQQVSGPHSQRTETKSPSLGPSPASPVSPPQGCEEMGNSAVSLAAAAKASGNTRSIFCPATSSLFEAKSPLSMAHPLTPPPPPSEDGSPRGSPLGCRRSSSGPPLKGGSQRAVALCTLSPQPFARRTASDPWPGLRARLPGSGTTSCAWAPQGALSSSSEDAAPWSSPRAPEPKGGEGAAPPDFCVLGHGLHPPCPVQAPARSTAPGEGSGLTGWPARPRGCRSSKSTEEPAKRQAAPAMVGGQTPMEMPSGGLEGALPSRSAEF